LIRDGTWVNSGEKGILTQVKEPFLGVKGKSSLEKTERGDRNQRASIKLGGRKMGSATIGANVGKMR